ncbi:MAG: TrkH family potassium uptake protein [Micavibrio aeruginosavorus]|uniref:TrkH family potassium uptake protein n=1 Tax=Micavibrio aeruginosavorus TaxID=349221 RepID=A0A7T5UGB5_9BACT|nr:MAG: TrkH family potassium uptake protein [Micavibrio aeruginosavorus]
MDFRPILYVMGMLLCLLAAGMTAPLLVDLYYNHADWKVFFLSICICTFFGGTLILSNGGCTGEPLNIRQAFVLTACGWLVMATFGAMPLWHSAANLSFTDAFFEATSAITTTGSTVMVGLDTSPPGILLWRSILQAFGGIGFIVMALTILPFLKVGGMQLFQTESSDKSDKALPRIRQNALAIAYIYVFLVTWCAMTFWFCGMSGFDAINHAMTAIATGGLSTHDASFSFFKNPLLEWVATFFMILGALPFVLFIRIGKGEWKHALNNSQARSFIKFLAMTILFFALWLSLTHGRPFGEALRAVSFNVVSVVTTTGFMSEDYTLWGSFAVGVFFILTFVGGCTGSTSGGTKVMRFQVMWSVFRRQMFRLVHPHGVFPITYEGKSVSEETLFSVIVYIFALLLSFATLTMILAFFGLDLVTSISGAATALTNVGPGLGSIIGPAGNFSTLPDGAKWALSFGMVLGRLELLTLLVLFSPYLWRR